MTFDAPRTPRGGASRTAWIVGSVALAAIGVMYLLREVFGPLFAALGIAYVLEPVVQHLCARGYKRTLSVCVVFALALLIGALLVAVVALQANSLLDALMADSNGLVKRSVDTLTGLINQQLGNLQEGELGERIRDPRTWTNMVGPLATTLGLVLREFLGWVEIVGALLLTPIYTFYLMLELPGLWKQAEALLPSADRERTLRVLNAIHAGMAAFLRGRVVIALLKGLLISAGLWAIGAPYAWVVGMASGALSVLPLVGPLIGWLLAIGVSLVDLPGPLQLVWVTIAYVACEALENFVLTPWVMKEGVSLHPLTVLFCVFFWGALFGAFGALLAIPLTIVLKIVLAEYLLPQVQRLARG
ncbi:MAG: AI-2E family transporter [Planctomycetes bacterium]|nr:AI-2E family transporter [Planctomycetota bacterium]